MIVSADERRQILNLLNVAEAARVLGMEVQEMYREIRRGNIPGPTVKIARRRYYAADDLIELTKNAAIDS